MMTSGHREPLHSTVAALIRKKIKAHRPGDKLHTVRVQAQELGVSAITVRTALLMLAQEGLVELRHGSGCYVCDPQDKRHVAILVELDILRDGYSRFYAPAVQFLREYLQDHGIASRLYIGFVPPGHQPETDDTTTCKEFMVDLEANRISAVASIATPQYWTLTTPLKRRGIPFVGSDLQNSRQQFFDAAVDVDHASMVRYGVQRLFEAGRKRLAMLSWSKEAIAIFIAELKDRGIEHNPKWVGSEFEPGQEGAGWSMFREIWTAQHERPDGLLVCDDMFLDDAKSAILQFGINVPDDLFIVTHANKGSRLHTPFPTVKIQFDPAEFAARMGELIIKLLKKEAVEQSLVKLPFEVLDSEVPTTELAAAQLHPAHKTTL